MIVDGSSARTISAIVTAHSEAVLAGPSMRSAELAVSRAEAEGFRVERIIGLDSPTPGCRGYFEQYEATGWRILEVDRRDQGLARNAYADASNGRYIAFLDADDLWSENWLSEAGRIAIEAEAAGECVVVHPEMNWFFGGSAARLVNIEQESLLFDPRHFLFRNYYDALAFSPRAAHLDLPFPDRDIEGGYAYEDMQWSIETMAAGWRHRVARNTIIFKRRRQDSQTMRASQRGVVIRDLEALRIENVASLGSRSD